MININTSIVDNSTLEIEVINTGYLKKYSSNQAETNSQTGLNNIKKRLAFLYPEASKFELYEKTDRVHAKITLTKLRNINAE